MGTQGKMSQGWYCLRTGREKLLSYSLVYEFCLQRVEEFPVEGGQLGRKDAEASQEQSEVR